MVYYFESFGTRQHTALSQYIYAIMLHISEVLRSGVVSAPSLHAYRARALAHLFQPSQGRLNEPRLSVARSDHTSQTNRALEVKRTQIRLRLPSVSTPLFSRILHTQVSTRPHSPS